MTDPPRITLAGLAIADPPERWAALGFAVDETGEAAVGDVRLTLGMAPPGQGIVGWRLRHLTGDGDVAGLTTRVAAPPAASVVDVPHPNGALSVDHVVIAAPDFDAAAAALAARGLALRRVAERGGRRQGFRRIGAAIMEIVEAPEAPGPAFWGVTMTVADLGALTALGPLVSEPHPAVQPGRRIATVTPGAGLSTRLAFMDPGPAGD